MLASDWVLTGQYRCIMCPSYVRIMLSYFRDAAGPRNLVPRLATTTSTSSMATMIEYFVIHGLCFTHNLGLLASPQLLALRIKRQKN